jgi:hypothetical protein
MEENPMHQDESLHEELVAEVKAIAPVMVEHSSEWERLVAWMLLRWKPCAGRVSCIYFVLVNWVG